MICLLLTIACNEESLTNKDNNYIKPHYDPSLNFNDTINLIGQQHNECLDTLLTRYKRIKSEEDECPDMSWPSFSVKVAYEFTIGKGWNVDYLDTTQFVFDSTYLENLTFEDIINSDPSLSSEAILLIRKLDTALNLYENDGFFGSFISNM